MSKREISEQLRQDLELFREQIRSEKHPLIRKWVQDQQEYILGQLSLILNPIFRDTIEEWREKHKIPLFEGGKFHRDWIMEHLLENLPDDDTDERIYTLCKRCHVNPKIYGAFVITYLYYRDPRPYRMEKLSPFSQDPHFRAVDEFRYKSRIELDHGMPREEEYTDNTQRLSIRIFKDTTKGRLIEFIEENWKDIQELQKDLLPYPHRKKYEKFERDIQVYILYLLGNSASDIANIMQRENIPDELDDVTSIELEKDYLLEMSRISEIVSDVAKSIKSINE